MATSLPFNPATVAISEARRRIFESVFPPNTSASIPTPLATTAGSFVQTTPSHGYNTRHHPHPTLSPAVDPASSVNLLPSPSITLAKETHAWHIATTFLSFGNEEFSNSFQAWLESHREPSQEVLEAIRYLLLNNEDGNVDGRDNLIEWYECEVRRHFIDWVKPQCNLAAPRFWQREDPTPNLERTLKTLMTAQSIYVHRLKYYMLGSPGDVSPRKAPKKGRRRQRGGISDSDDRVKAFLKDLNSIISYSLPDPVWSSLVFKVFVWHCGAAVGLQPGDFDFQDLESYSSRGLTMKYESEDADHDNIVIYEESPPMNEAGIHLARAVAKNKVLELWKALETLGMGGGGRRGEKVFADVVNCLITSYIRKTFTDEWHSPSRAGEYLKEWVEHVLGRLIVDVLFSFTLQGSSTDARLDKLSPRESLRASRQSLDKRRKGTMEIDEGAGAGEEERRRRIEDLEVWKKISINRLGRLRVHELFDIVIDWPNSLGGIEDLKAYVTTPPTRMHLINTYTTTLNTRLLHPAAATGDIIACYIRMIRAFTTLDSRGVLLDRVSRGIRNFLRQRQDTVHAVVKGIMSESLGSSPDDGDEEQDLRELAAELSKGIPAQNAATAGVEDLDYDDMSWMPDPIDVGPEFKRSKGLDVVGSLFSLYDTKEPWMKEVQAILMFRLLQDTGYEFSTEIRIIELLKLRCGEALTQGSDVMLKDMADSKRADQTIREFQKLDFKNPHSRNPEPAIELHAKILSRLYWPSIRTETIKLPPEVSKLMGRYQKGFEKLKTKRKIDWTPLEGIVELELELEDRVVTIVDATPAHAAVIHHFGGDDGEGSHKTFSFEQLASELSMRDEILRGSLDFWMDKAVIREKPKGIYSVMETLDTLLGTPPTHHSKEEEDVVTEVDEEKKKERAIIEQFVIGMLTNGGAMPTERMVMMLGMLVPGGFSWSSEEFAEHLTEMAKRDLIEISGPSWKIVKQQAS